LGLTPASRESVGAVRGTQAKLLAKVGGFDAGAGVVARLSGMITGKVVVNRVGPVVLL